MYLNEIEAKQMLKEAGINIIDTFLATSKKEAVEFSKKFNSPVVLKIVSPDIIHKSDIGGVKVGLKTRKEVKQAYEDIMAGVIQKQPEARILGVAVQPMAPSGAEVIIGMIKDPQLGPALMFGLGGIYIELIKDVAFRVTPIDRQVAREMIRGIKGYELLTGFRGQPAVDLAALEEILVKVSQFVEANPQIKELELNPVIAYPEGARIVDARINLEESSRPIKVNVEGCFKPDGLDFLFYPQSVAVVGASNNPNSRGYDFMQHLINFGYRGNIYPVNLKNSEVLGIKAYPSLESVPNNVDHVIYCIGLENMPSFLDDCVKKRVKSIHIFSARGAETGRIEAKALENKIKRKAEEYSIRLLGPNCMGIYCPESGLSFCPDFSRESGNIGAIIQSGGSSTDIARYGALRGLRFSKLISYGNALDINEMELLKYLSDDPKTDIIIAFIEGLRGNGKAFLDLVQKTTVKKPLIICKGGLSQAGSRATMSHTASVAGPSLVWNSAIRQAGGIPVRDIDDLVHLAVGFSFIAPIRGRRVGTGGSGGGRNTVSVDEWESNGFDVVPLPQYIRDEFKSRGAILWDCLDNPADRSITVPGDPYTVPDLFKEMAQDPNFDFICANGSADDHPYNRETFADWIVKMAEGFFILAKETSKPFFLILSERPLGEKDLDYWLWREFAHIRTRAIQEKVAFFPNVDKAAEVVNELIAYHMRKPAIVLPP